MEVKPGKGEGVHSFTQPYSVLGNSNFKKIKHNKGREYCDCFKMKKLISERVGDLCQDK